VLRRIFGPKGDEVTAECRKLYIEELNDLHSSVNIIRVIKSRRMSWTGHVARMARGEVYTGFWWENLRGNGHLKHPGVDGRIILRWIFRRWDGGTDWIDLAQDKGRWLALVNAVMNLRVP